MESKRAGDVPGGVSLLDGWFTRADVAAQLGISEDTLYRWELQRKGPPCVRVSRGFYYRAEAFSEWMKAREEERAIPLVKNRRAK